MNQSGIKVSSELNSTITRLAKEIRALKISILNETLEANGELPAAESFEEDLHKVATLVDDNEAAYILVRKDDDSYIFISFVSDGAKVKDKMIYASTRNTLSRELGSKISSSHFATTKEELSKSALITLGQTDPSDKPLSEREKELENVRAAEHEHVVSTQTKRAIASSGVSFPISQAAEEALNVLKTTAVSRMVSLLINTKTETIDLADHKELPLDELASAVPSDQPRYTFFSWVHEVEGAGITTQCFIYTCPSSSKVRERMLYSSNRQSIIASSGLTIDHKYEAEELDLDYLKSRLSPPKEVKSTGFSRPKRPGKK